MSFSATATDTAGSTTPGSTITTAATDGDAVVGAVGAGRTARATITAVPGPALAGSAIAAEAALATVCLSYGAGDFGRTATASVSADAADSTGSGSAPGESAHTSVTGVRTAAGNCGDFGVAAVPS